MRQSQTQGEQIACTTPNGIKKGRIKKETLVSYNPKQNRLAEGKKKSIIEAT